jgi:PKD repeat protein
MKQHYLALAFFLCFFSEIKAQNLFQDTTFTDPVLVSFASDFVTFKNCRFINISGDALTIEGSGVLISNCRFDQISGNAVYALGSEVYLTEDTLSRIGGQAVLGELSAVIVLKSQISEVVETGFACVQCAVSEMTETTLSNVGSGVRLIGNAEYEESYLVNNTIRQVNNGNGIEVADVDVLTIFGVTLDSCMGQGIYLSQVGEAGLESVLLQNNHISRTNLNGIMTEGVLNAVVRNNEVSYPGFLGGDSLGVENCMVWKGNNAKIENNRFHHAEDADCVVTDCPANGLVLYAPATVTRNTIHHCTGAGIAYLIDLAPAETDLLVYNNIVYDVAGNAFAYTGYPVPGVEPANVEVKNNTFHVDHSEQAFPTGVIYFADNSTKVNLAGNIIVYEDAPGFIPFVSIFGGGPLLDTLNVKTDGDIGFVDYAGRDFHLASANTIAHNFLPFDFGLPNDDFDGEVRLGQREAGADELSEEAVLCGCNNCPNEIPDLYFGDFTFSVLAAQNNDLASSTQGVCGVRVEFQHEYIGDITMELVSPAGQVVQLMGPSGLFGSTENTTWNVGFLPCNYPVNPDPGFPEVWSNNVNWGEGGAYTGTYFPAGGCLEDFTVGSVIGDWTLRVTDNQADDRGNVLGFEVMFCDLAGVSCFACSGPPVAQFSTTSVGAWAMTIGNQSTGGATDFDIDFGDGQTASVTAFPIFHAYENAGNYTLRIIATNECGVDTFVQNVNIAGARPSAFAFGAPTTGCEPLAVQLTATDPDHVDTWEWLLPGATPSVSFEQSPAVVYNSSGTYFATLVLHNEVGSDTLFNIVSITVLPNAATPGFQLQTVGDSIICINTTPGTDAFYWTLNGGDPEGADTSPYVFEVSESGFYVVGLTVSNACSALTLNETIEVNIVSVGALADAGWIFGLSPNPNTGEFTLRVAAPENASAVITGLNALGVQILTQNTQILQGENSLPFDLSGFPAGVYHLRVQTTSGSAVLRVVKQ